MIRISKVQKEIEVLAERVPQLSEEQKDWARSHFNYYRVVRQGTTETRCPNCNSQVSIYHNEGRRKGSKWSKHDHTITCPHCGASIQVRVIPDYSSAGRGWNNHQEDFFQIMNVVGDWQVTRLVYMQRYCYVRKESTPWEYYEVCQAWNNPNHKKTYFRAFPKGMCMHHPLNPYKLNDYVSRKDEQGNYVRDSKGYFMVDAIPCILEPRKTGGANYFDTNAICPIGAKILPALRKRGVNMRTIRWADKQLGRSAMWLMESVSCSPMHETLLKAKEWELFKEVSNSVRDEGAKALFNAWKICQRNRYDVHANMVEWIDYVHMLMQEHKDVRNPHYVCPPDLHGAHQTMLERKRRAEEKERERIRRENDERARIAAEEAMKQAVKEEAAFVERRKQYFDLEIPSPKGFTIVVLKTINDFKEEGLALNHCVFRMGYYLRQNSLILSARDTENHPIETIELDLPSLTIRQCYGEHDTFSPLHNAIVSTMKANLWQVQQRMALA